MKTFLRILRWCVSIIVSAAVIMSALFAYFVYTPEPEKPNLPGTLASGSIDVGGLRRTYQTYIPHQLRRGVPLVFVMHGSGESADRMRRETGYGFDRLADEHQFALVYPNAHRSARGDWNACGTVGDTGGVDDVAFLSTLATKLVTEIGADARRVFAAGSSRGGFMALRLALEAPDAFRAVAAVAANVHTPDNFKCKPARNGTSSVMLMNGTKDPLVPFDGGAVSLLGLFYKYGTVMSASESAQYFADLNHMVGAPMTSESPLADDVRVKDVLWRNDSGVEVELVEVDGAGHGIPQPYRRHPRLLGPSRKAPNGPDVIWRFFDRQTEIRQRVQSLK
jgi:polyhydroxybutyrate depolymerase